jgi:hypothetical protein
VIPEVAVVPEVPDVDAPLVPLEKAAAAAASWISSSHFRMRAIAISTSFPYGVVPDVPDVPVAPEVPEVPEVPAPEVPEVPADPLVPEVVAPLEPDVPDEVVPEVPDEKCNPAATSSWKSLNRLIMFSSYLTAENPCSHLPQACD